MLTGSSVSLSSAVASWFTGYDAGGAPQASDALGEALAAGDFNGDGASDLGAGAPGRSLALVFYGSPRCGNPPHQSATDDDGDALGDSFETLRGLDPVDCDEDHNTVLDGEDDWDADGLTNAEEESEGTDPFDADSDNDGLDDGYEVDNGIDPLDPDTDDDGANDGDEVAAGTDPLVPDQPADLPALGPLGGALLCFLVAFAGARGAGRSTKRGSPKSPSARWLLPRWRGSSATRRHARAFRGSLGSGS